MGLTIDLFEFDEPAPDLDQIRAELRRHGRRRGSLEYLGPPDSGLPKRGARPGKAIVEARCMLDGTRPYVCAVMLRLGGVALDPLTGEHRPPPVIPPHLRPGWREVPWRERLRMRWRYWIGRR